MVMVIVHVLFDVVCNACLSDAEAPSYVCHPVSLSDSIPRRLTEVNGALRKSDY